LVKKEKKIKCKFCGEEVDKDKIIFGTTSSINICEKCVDLCKNILAGRKVSTSKTKGKTLTPRDIKEHLDEYVVGQDYAKKALSVAIYNHYKRVFKTDIKEKEDIEIQKSNLLMIGPTGAGKTHLIRTIAKFLEVPMIITDASSITSAGYVGLSVEDILTQLLNEADGNIDVAQRGIIILDEIDKLKATEESGKDVNGGDAQSSILKLIEGNKFDVEYSKNTLGSNMVSIDTSNILFVCMGSFSGLEEIIAKRISKKEIGFGCSTEKVKPNENLIHQVQQQDLYEFGLVRELIGRLQIIITLDSLNEDTLVKVLTQPKDALIKQYQQLFKFDNIALSFDDEAIHKIAKIAIKRKTGARGLKSVLEDSLMDAMYSLPGTKTKKHIVHESDIKEKHTNTK